MGIGHNTLYLLSINETKFYSVKKVHLSHLFISEHIVGKKGAPISEIVTYIFHKQVELVDVSELLQILQCHIQFTWRLIHECFHGDQVVTQEL